MPHYDYVCDACDIRFELYQSITAAVKRKCPDCGQQKLRRLIGPGAAIMFKGSGFYVTDNRRSSSTGTPGERKTKEEGAASESKSEAKTETSEPKSSDKANP